jgi:chromate reductase, NAD(P)H dehydrogenase (quinone)
MQAKILCVCGSSRRGSLNQRLLDIAALGATQEGGAATHIRLRDFQLPIYDGDMETTFGLPPQALDLKKLLAQHHALLIATPEYNGGYSGLLKNALDWMSRPTQEDSSGRREFSGKLAALVSASPGPLGGVRSQIALQMALSKLGLLVIPEACAVSHAHEAFDELGQLKDPASKELAHKVGAALVRRVSTSTNGFRETSHEDAQPVAQRT